MGEEKLFEEYGIITEWKNGKPYFSGLGKVMAATLYGNSSIYNDVSKSMADIEKLVNGNSVEGQVRALTEYGS